MGLMLYRVLPASGGFVNGAEVAIGADVALTGAEARYEVDAGNVLPLGMVAPGPVTPSELLDTDFIQSLRGLFPRPVPIAALERFLTRDGGTLDTFFDARGDGIAVAIAAAVDRQLAGKASPADIVTALRPILAEIAGLLPANGNLAGLTDAAAARSNLDLGSSATLDLADLDEATSGTGDRLLSTSMAMSLLRARLLPVLLAILDGLPELPADASAYPAGGALYRNGDANGFSLVRISPKVS